MAKHAEQSRSEVSTLQTQGRARAAVDVMRARTPESIKRVVRPVLHASRSSHKPSVILPEERDIRDDRATPDDLLNCFRLLLGRVPSERGFRGWLKMVEEGSMSINDLVGAFLASAEFRLRLQRTFGWTEGEIKKVEIEGLPFYIRSNELAFGAALAARQLYEPHVLWFLKQQLHEGDTFVDVGASVGYFSVLLGRHVGATGKVLAFEPGPQNQSVLLLNTFVNKTPAQTFPVALGDAEGLLTYSRNGANGMVLPFDGDPAALAVTDLVRCTTLDSFVGTQPIHAMKIDVEGAEGRVLAGSTSTLERQRPSLVFEFAPPAIEAGSGITADALLRNLADSGYVFDALVSPGQQLEKRTAAEMIDYYRVIEDDHFDIAAWPAEKSA